jgi:hypothetical protein
MTRDRLCGELANVALIFFVVLGAYFAVRDAIRNPMPVAASRVVPPTSSPVDILQPGPGGQPVISYDPRTETLTITEHAPRKLLICMGATCDLREGWRLR